MSRKITALRADRRWPGSMTMADTQLDDKQGTDAYFREVHSVKTGQYLHRGGLAFVSPVEVNPLCVCNHSWSCHVGDRCASGCGCSRFDHQNRPPVHRNYRVIARWHHEHEVWVRYSCTFKPCPKCSDDGFARDPSGYTIQCDCGLATPPPDDWWPTKRNAPDVETSYPFRPETKLNEWEAFVGRQLVQLGIIRIRAIEQLQAGDAVVLGNDGLLRRADRVGPDPRPRFDVVSVEPDGMSATIRFSSMDLKGVRYDSAIADEAQQWSGAVRHPPRGADLDRIGELVGVDRRATIDDDD